MLHKETIDAATLELLKRLMGDECLQGFVLVAHLSSRFSLEQMLKFYEGKYQANPLMPLKGIVYFADINKNAPVKMANGKPLDWKSIEKLLLAMEKFPQKVFPQL